MSRLRLAAAQIECHPGDIEGNLAEHLRVLAKANSLGIDVVVFPELSLPGYETAPSLESLAIDGASPYLRELAAECRTLAAAVGFIERYGDRFYNATAILQDGGIRHIHRKINLPSYGNLREGEFFTAGTDITAVKHQGWTLATLVCADTWNPALPWLAALKGIDLLLVPAASARDAVHPEFDSPAGWEVNLRHTALTYGLPVVMANHCGTHSNLRFWGGSRMVDPHGHTLALAGPDEALIVAEVDSTDVKIARDRLPTMRTASPEFVAAALQDMIQQAPDANRS